jgi:hypothetical protein
MTPLLSPKTSGNQIREGLGLWGSKHTRDADTSPSEFTRSLEAAGYDSFGALPMPELVARPLRPAFCCFPHASPVLPKGAGKQKTAPKDRNRGETPGWGFKRSFVDGGRGLADMARSAGQGC